MPLDKDQKNYHCHEGIFKGGSFPSKIEMIRLLKVQFLNLGRPWPYGEVAEEDITSPRPKLSNNLLSPPLHRFSAACLFDRILRIQIDKRQ